MQTMAETILSDDLPAHGFIIGQRVDQIELITATTHSIRIWFEDDSYIKISVPDNTELALTTGKGAGHEG